MSERVRKRRLSERNAMSATIDRATREALHRFVRILAQRGCPAAVIQEEVTAACRGIARSGVSDASPERRLEDSAHVLTLWFSDPVYTGPEGSPRPLRLSGPAPSLESLIHRVDPQLKVGHVLESMLKGGALRRVGARFVPRRRALIFRDAESMRDTLGGLFGLLKTLEHNRWGPPENPRLEVYSFNRNVPLSAVPELERKMRPMAERMISRSDTTMHESESERKRGERTVHMGIGVYQWIVDPVASVPPNRPTRSKRSRSR